MLRGLARLGATRLGATQRLAPPLLRAAAGPSMLPAPSIAASTFGAFKIFGQSLASSAPAQKSWNPPPGGLKSFKPTSPGIRHRVIINKKGLWPGRSVPKLTKRLRQWSGRSSVTGRITIRGRETRSHKRKYRIIDFHRKRTDAAVVDRFEYDPNRSAWIALLRYQEDDALAYILAPQDLNVGDTVRCGEGAPFSPGNAMPLQFMPDGTIVHNIEIRPGWGGKMMRAAGTSAKLQSKDEKYALLKLQSGEIRKVLLTCTATIGEVSNPNWQHRVLGKAGASRWIGRRPKVRGVAMNAVDHPMGGGEGKSSGGRPSVSPWGWYTKGLRTRNKKQHSSKLIMRRRNHEKLGLRAILYKPGTGRGSW